MATDDLPRAPRTIRKHVVYTRLFSYQGDDARQVFAMEPPDDRPWMMNYTSLETHLIPPTPGSVLYTLVQSVVWELMEQG